MNTRRLKHVSGSLLVLSIFFLVAGCGGSSSGDSGVDPSFTVAGFYSTSAQGIPCYWTETGRTDLPASDAIEAFAFSTALSGGTVYNSGLYSDGTKTIACYWTGTDCTDLAGDGEHDAVAFSIAVSDETVYTAGYYNDGEKDIACYWSGTDRIDLEGDGTHGAHALSISFRQ